VLPIVLWLVLSQENWHAGCLQQGSSYACNVPALSLVSCCCNCYRPHVLACPLLAFGGLARWCLLVP
jgi:hypothetical protein